MARCPRCGHRWYQHREHVAQSYVCHERIDRPHSRVRWGSIVVVTDEYCRCAGYIAKLPIAAQAQIGPA